MATTPPFKYQPMFEKGKDTTEYYLLTKDYVSVSEFEGKPVLKIEKEGLTAMANAAFRDVSFMLRRSHNEQVAKILSDPEASDNDKYVALTFLRNAEVASKGVLPFCQDTGTAIIHGEKGQQVWTGYCDEEALSLGVYKTYTEENLRYSPWMIAVPVSWQKGSIPLAATSALRRKVNATYLSFSLASGSLRIFATCSLCARRSMKDTSRKAVLAIAVRPSFCTFSTGVPSNSLTDT